MTAKMINAILAVFVFVKKSIPQREKLYQNIAKRKKEILEFSVEIAINEVVKITAKWNLGKYLLFSNTFKKAAVAKIKPTGPKITINNLG